MFRVNRKVATATAIALSFAMAAIGVLRVSEAGFSAQTSTTGGWATGVVSISDDDAGSALFSTSTDGLLDGGQSLTRCIAVTYTGTMTNNVAIRLYGASSGALAPYLNLTVEEGTGGGAGTCTGFNATSALYSGDLAAFTATRNTFTSGASAWAVTGTPETRTYRLTLTVQNVPAAQSKAATGTFTWEAKTITPPNYGEEVLNDAPVSYWRMNQDVPSVTATANSNYSGEEPTKAVDGRPDTFWTTNGGSTGWLRLQPSVATALTDYSIRRRDDVPARNPKDWTFEGSLDGTTWTMLDTRAGITWPTSNEFKSFTFANTTAYSYYRLNVTANNGDGYLSVAEITSPTGLAFVDSSPQMNYASRVIDVTSSTPAAAIPGKSALLASGGYLQSSKAIGSITDATVEAWIKTTAGTGNIQTQRTVNGEVGLTLQVGSAVAGAFGQPGEVSFGVDSAALYRGVSTTTARVNDGQWHHIVAVWDGTAGVAVTPSQFSIYIDGVPSAVTARDVAGSITAPITLAAPTRLGCATQWGTTFLGNLDEVAIYTSALTATRIARHYQAGTGG